MHGSSDHSGDLVLIWDITSNLISGLVDKRVFVTVVVKDQDEKDRDGKQYRQFWYELCLEEKKNPASLAGSIRNATKKIQEYRDDSKLLPFPVWQDAVNAGIVSDRKRYISLIREISISLAISDLEKRSNKDEMALIHLVRILDETDKSISRLSEKVEDYYIAQHLAELPGDERNIWSLIDAIARDRDHPLNHLAKNIHRLHDSRTCISSDVREYAGKILPNMSALCGPLVSARLLARVGSRSQLARMPAASLQVLGAGPSLFAHLSSGSDPPKHGIIYQYKGVRHAKRQLRGRVSRVLACQLATAARIDYYRGAADEEFLRKASEKITLAGKLA
jgi:nucleolar protein 56